MHKKEKALLFIIEVEQRAKTREVAPVESDKTGKRERGEAVVPAVVLSERSLLFSFLLPSSPFFEERET